MVTKASNVVVGKPLVSGGLLVAPVGTAVPTNETTALNAAFNAVGYITEDGFTRSETRDTENRKAWGGDIIAVLDRGTEVTIMVGLAEYLSELTLGLIYGDANVTVTPASGSAGKKVAVKVTAEPSPHKTWVVEMLRGGKKGRLVIPDVQITEREDITYSDEDISARGVTAVCFPDAAGVFIYEYWDDGVTVAA